MIVVDASAMVAALVGRVADPRLLDVLAGDVAAPQIIDIEVLSALRGLVLGHKVPTELAESARRHHFETVIHRYEIAPLAGRIWELRHQYTAYDAAYLALAEALSVPLHTCDAKLDRGGHDVKVQVHLHQP